MSVPASLVERSSALRLARDVLREREPWLVGGSVRDLLTGRELIDIDLVVPERSEQAARELARACRGSVFPLSERFGAWRVLAADRSWQADLTPVRDGSIEADLALRDFTINAMALTLVGDEILVDPHGGRADLDTRVLRVLAERSYRDDPLRTLRLARFSCELELAPEPATKELAAKHAAAITGVAAERIFYELRKLIVADEVMAGLELMDEIGLIGILLPELEALKGVEQNPYHHLDVWGHTLAVLGAVIELEREPDRVLGEAADAVVAELGKPLADELSRQQALRLGALFHDVGKPATRRTSAEGRILFWGHDKVGAEMVQTACRRLRTSTELGDFLAGLARQHLRLGFLVRERPLSRRDVYRYLRACEPVELEVTVLSVADRLATLGERTREEAVQAHLDLARELAGEAVAWRASSHEAPIRGDELMRELGLEAGPKVGELLELLREAAFAGEVDSAEDAIELARQAL